MAVLKLEIRGSVCLFVWRLNAELGDNTARSVFFVEEALMLLDEIRFQKDRILTLGNQFGAKRIRVFGSVAQREDRPDSDVDFLVDVARGKKTLKRESPRVWFSSCDSMFQVLNSRNIAWLATGPAKTAGWIPGRS